MTNEQRKQMRARAERYKRQDEEWRERQAKTFTMIEEPKPLSSAPVYWSRVPDELPELRVLLKKLCTIFDNRQTQREMLQDIARMSSSTGLTPHELVYRSYESNSAALRAFKARTS